MLALCAGVGGLELGLGLGTGGASRPVCYVERGAFNAARLAQRMQEGHLPLAPIHSDLKAFDGRPWAGVVDLVTAGYPCQPFSSAGKRLGAEDPRHLWPDVLRVLRQSQAPLLFCENVRGHVSNGLREVLEDLASLGFSAEWDLFSAEEEGSPHIRERLFVLAYADGQRRNQVRELWQRESHLGRCAEALAHANRGGLSGERQSQPGGIKRTPGNLADGRALPGRLWDGGRNEWWVAEPAVGRVAHGVANRVDRLRATGNGVVPAVAARAWLELTGRALA